MSFRSVIIIMADSFRLQDEELKTHRDLYLHNRLWFSMPTDFHSPVVDYMWLDEETVKDFCIPTKGAEGPIIVSGKFSTRVHNNGVCSNVNELIAKEAVDFHYARVKQLKYCIRKYGL